MRGGVFSLREKYGCIGKCVLLGVAFGWGKAKGLDVFVDLAAKLAPHYQVIMVGTNEEVDKLLPNNIIHIHRTQNQTELAEIYSMADLFVNCTREEVLGMVNIEALACGTPVVTFNTGGSPECIDSNCGSVVEKDNIVAMEQEIHRICTQKPYSVDACIARAREFEYKKRYAQYIDLFESVRNK